MNEPVRPEDMRVSDIERTRVQDRLRRAHDVGQLDLTEFDERVKAIWAAKTRGDLELATADLPLPPPEPKKGERRPVFSDTGGGVAMRVLTIIWASLLVANVTIWGILALAGIVVHPWPAYLIAPGAVLAVLYASGIGRPPRDS
ncbi:DUF1707 SHOCT-like domain-containing protein [Pseudonocardia sp. TRM90224]|uniref:DUF1707 SHOCT-like domain-containing protein n=1 Tax=Pseudonocardia sp. TRM90224 TaxID=2812678 RepID=UPI001E2B2CB0|nr:DUF1707 domain-containing protein [Pseudonocardia sp. TRM90224]